MNKVALIAAVVAGIGGALLLLLHKQNFENRVSGGPPVAILVAAADIPLGSELSEQLVAVREVPEAYVDARQVRAEDAQSVMGVRVSLGLGANESILWSDLATSSGDRRDLSGLVTRGLRAVSIRTSTESTFGGLLRPGDRVDVLLTSQTDGRQVTVPLLQNVLVLAVGSNTGGAYGREGGGRGEVTLSVTIAQAQVIAHARAEGVVTLVLRNPNDITVVEQMPETTRSDLIDSEQRAKLQSRRVRPAQPQGGADDDRKEIENVR